MEEQSQAGYLCPVPTCISCITWPKKRSSSLPTCTRSNKHLALPNSILFPWDKKYHLHSEKPQILRCAQNDTSPRCHPERSEGSLVGLWGITGIILPPPHL